MDKTEKTPVIPLDYIRGLVVAQNAKCAITGIKLSPKDVNADHIVPLSREDLQPNSGKENIWLVDKRINSMKGTMSYEEFVQLAKKIIEHEKETRELLERIRSGAVSPMAKPDFDGWVSMNCDGDGIVKS